MIFYTAGRRGKLWAEKYLRFIERDLTIYILMGLGCTLGIFIFTFGTDLYGSSMFGVQEVCGFEDQAVMLVSWRVVCAL